MKRQGVNGNGEMLYGFFREHDPVQVDASHDGMTRQEFADECDINVLMQTYERTGVISHINPKAPAYFDTTNVPDLQEAMAVMGAAETAFMTLPAKVRREFDNDPLQFVEYAQDPANVSRMREWGLAAPEKPAGEFNGLPATQVAPDPSKATPEPSKGKSDTPF